MPSEKAVDVAVEIWPEISQDYRDLERAIEPYEYTTRAQNRLLEVGYSEEEVLTGMQIAVSLSKQLDEIDA